MLWASNHLSGLISQVRPVYEFGYSEEQDAELSDLMAGPPYPPYTPYKKWVVDCTERFMADINASLHITKRKRKSNIQHYCKSDDFRAGFEVAKWRMFCHWWEATKAACRSQVSLLWQLLSRSDSISVPHDHWLDVPFTCVQVCLTAPIKIFAGNEFSMIFLALGISFPNARFFALSLSMP